MLHTTNQLAFTATKSKLQENPTYTSIYMNFIKLCSSVHFFKVLISSPDTDLNLSVYRHISFALKFACACFSSGFLLLFQRKVNNLVESQYRVSYMLDIFIQIVTLMYFCSVQYCDN